MFNFSRQAKLKVHVPNLIVSQRVLDKMRIAARTHLEDETGEAMIGLVVPATIPSSLPTVYILDTISPDETAVRQMHTFQQGDDRQDELIWWLQENWQLVREKRGGVLNRMFNGKWDVPLRYLGDWHKQPGYMIQPSGGDLMTALDWIDDPDNKMNFLITPIITLDHPSTIGLSNINTNYVLISTGEGASMRVDFWYISDEAGMFLPIAPTIYPEDQLPTLAPYPWHLADVPRAEAEIKALNDDELFHSITLYDTDQTAPLEICFLVARVGAEKLLILVTHADYPKTPPQVRYAPFIHMNSGDDMYRVFENAWKQSQPLDVDYTWTEESHLVDILHAAEAVLGIKRPSQEQPVEPVTPVASDEVIPPEGTPTSEKAEPDTPPPSTGTSQGTEVSP